MTSTLTCDTSVLVAALSAWHEHHAVARSGLGRVDWLPAHVLAETVSVLSRLPHGHAVSTADAAELVHRVVTARGGTVRQLRGDRYLSTFRSLAEAGLNGGAVYDAVVGATAREHEATLLTLDVRARRTYTAVGVRFDVLA